MAGCMREWAIMDRIEWAAESLFEFIQGFWIPNSKIQLLLN
jgi:hypothetical protein